MESEIKKNKHTSSPPLGGRGVDWGVGRKVGWVLAILLLVLLIRHFCIGSYRISTYAMEDALHKGDFILVDKLNPKSLNRNQVVLFTSPLQKDKNESPLILSRCVALPGDTIQVSKNGYKINGVLYPRSPYMLQTYSIGREMKDVFVSTLEKLSIPLRDPKEGKNTISVSLTPFEEYQLREEMSERMNTSFKPEETDNYTLIVPRKGQRYRLTEAFMIASREAILAEAPGKVTFRNKRLQVDGKDITTFQFSRDYYWVLSDNQNDAIDSRHVGFVPADHIIGKAWFCWYSKDKQRRFKKIN